MGISFGWLCQNEQFVCLQFILAPTLNSHTQAIHVVYYLWGIQDNRMTSINR